MQNSAFAKKKELNPLDLSQKLEYVNLPFWQRYKDPCLEKYVIAAVQNNNTAREASWAVEQYRQEARKILGKELPILSVGANYVGFHIQSLLPQSDHANIFALPFTASWELDLLQKNRDRTKSAQKTYKAKQYDEKAAYIALVSDVATLYINILQYDYLIELQANYLSASSLLLERSNEKFIRGVVDTFDINSKRRDYENAKNDLNKYLKERETLINQLIFLTGLSNDEKIERLTLKEFEYSYIVPDSILSDVIFARPDVMAAEARLQAAKLDIRAARKELFPAFRVTGLLAFTTFFQANFFSWESVVAFLIAGATQDLFYGGRKIAQLKINKAIYEQMFEEYRKTDLNALREVNDALYMIKQDTEIDKNSIRKLSIQADDFKRSQNKFRRGVISGPDLLLEEQMLIAQQQMQAQTKAIRLVNYITLFKVLGGEM